MAQALRDSHECTVEQAYVFLGELVDIYEADHPDYLEEDLTLAAVEEVCAEAG